MRRTSALIIGGGPAGSAAAITLARGDAETLMIERHRETNDALCGGFLSWRTLETLEMLGVPSADLAGHPISKVSLYAEKQSASASLPEPGIGVSRRALDTALLARAEAEGASIMTGVAVREAALPPSAQLGTGEDIAADALFLATGKHDLRGLKRPAATDRDPWVGLRYRVRASERLRKAIDGVIELHIFDGGYAGLLLQEDGSANLCLATRKSRLSNTDGNVTKFFRTLVAEVPSLAERMEDEDLPIGGDAIGVVPYGWRATQGEPGLFRLGDQAAVIPSLAGEGVGIALASGVAAAETFLRNGADGAVSYQRNFAARAKRPLAVAGLIRKLAENPSRAAAFTPLARMPGLPQMLSRLTRIA